MAQVIEVSRTDRIFNAAVGRLARLGIGVAGARELTTTGRRSGQPRTVPVNPFVIAGVTYLVAPRGQTEWVRNVRADPRVVLRVGRRRTSYVATQVSEQEAVPALRVYLEKWAWEVGRFFPEGVTAKSSDAELAAIAPNHPVFRITEQDL